MIRIAICEDEKETQSLIENYLHNILKNINIEYEIQKYSLGEELLESNLKRNRYITFRYTNGTN
nr:hypothetical protein [Paeniclostridium hominis]